MSGTDPRYTLDTRVESIRRALANADERTNRSNHHDPIDTTDQRVTTRQTP